MPSTVKSVLAAAGLESEGSVGWGVSVPETASGVYVVAATADASAKAAAVPAPISPSAIEQLLRVRPELRLDGSRPGSEELADRIGDFWFPDEVVLYIGLAGTSVRTRVGQYYKTPLGARRPHAGGWWLKTLTHLDDVWVHWAATKDPDGAETAMLTGFADHVSASSRAGLHDQDRIAPFANLRAGSGLIKRHGIKGATAPKEPSAGASGHAQALTPVKSSTPLSRGSRAGTMSQPADTQRVTAKDVEAGRIRVPARSKHLLPSARADVTVTLRGRSIRARWDPRMGPPERSGVLAFGRTKLDGLVDIDEVLDITASADAAIALR